MQFYGQPHRCCCGVDLHAATMYVCILDAGGNGVCGRNIPAKPEVFLRLVKPLRDDLVAPDQRGG